jgi:hypothetical protein
MRSTIVARLPKPGWLRACPACRRWLTLRLVRRASDPHVGSLRIYRCAACSTEVTFAARRPPGTLGVGPD